MTDPQVIVNLGTGGSDLNGQNGTTSSADSNDARFLDWPGDNAGNYVYCPTGLNYLTVPDEAALDITGDIDLRAFVALDDWTPAVEHFLIYKWAASGDNRSYSLSIQTTGVLRLRWSETGAAATIRSADSTVAPTISDGDALWVRVTLDVDNGASGRDIKFFTSTDGSTWTQLGSTVTQATATSVNAGTATLDVGRNSTMKLYRAQVLDGIAGTTVLDVDTSVITSGSATSFTASTSQTVTINRTTSGRKSVAVVSPVWLFGTDDYMEVADNPLLDFGASDDFTVLTIVRQWDTPINDGRIMQKRDGSSPNVGYVLGNNGTAIEPIGTVDDGPNIISRSGSVKASGSLSVFGFRVDRTAQELRSVTDSLDGTGVSTSAVGSLSNAAALQIARFGATYQDFELLGVAVFRRALTADEIASINTYYQNKVA